jgi:hypothetical protein
MSGTAALSAARKRRASNAPGAMPNMTPTSFSNTPNPYYNSSPQIQPPPHYGGGGGGVPSVVPPNMTIHENIALIKMQMEQRLQLITSQGRSMPPEKLKMLQKQQEIQTQILKQKIEVAREMEHDDQAPHFPQMAQKHVAFQSNDVPKTTNGMSVPMADARTKHVQQANKGTMPTATLTPFVSMTSANGVIPPPIVILKSHDDKIGEHDAVLNDLSNRMNYMHNRIDQIERSSVSPQHDMVEQPRQLDNVNTETNEIGHDNHPEEEEEPTLLMEEVIGDLLNSRDFMQGVVDKIMNETNLADVVFKIDPIIKENQELRSLLHSQQEMLNQMNIMLMKFLNAQSQEATNSNHYDMCDGEVGGDVCDANGLYNEVNDESTYVESNNDTEQGEAGAGAGAGAEAPAPEEAEDTVVDKDDVEEQVTDQLVEHEVTDLADQAVEHVEDVNIQAGDTEATNADEQLAEENDDESGPNFPDVNRLKLLVSEIEASDL